MARNGRVSRPAQCPGQFWALYWAAVMTGFAALVTPAPGRAQAAGEEAAAAPEASVAILGTFIVAVLALIGMAWLRRRWSREQLRATHFQLMTANLEAALAAAPLAYAGWTATGQPVASQGFLERLGLAELLELDQVLDRLAPADRPRLERAFAALRSNGTAFEGEFHDLDGRALTLAGRRGRSTYALPDGSPAILDMLWLVRD